jgi:small subunit ribosomal protein S1
MYNVGDELEGAVTKVVTFGAFVEILDGVEGLVHISELAPYHVENPREIVNPGDEIKVKILEIDSERRRLSLSAKRVEDQILQPREGAPPPDDAGAGDLDDVPELGLSEDVFAAGGAEGTATATDEEIAPATADVVETDVPEAAAEAPPAQDAPEADAADEPAASTEEAPAEDEADTATPDESAADDPDA